MLQNTILTRQTSRLGQYPPRPETSLKSVLFGQGCSHSVIFSEIFFRTHINIKWNPYKTVIQLSKYDRRDSGRNFRRLESSILNGKPADVGECECWWWSRKCVKFRGSSFKSRGAMYYLNQLVNLRRVAPKMRES